MWQIVISTPWPKLFHVTKVTFHSIKNIII